MFCGLSVFAQEIEDLPDLSLEELMNLRVDQSATLTASSFLKTPASITRITDQDIDNSGARSLDELLRIYVPSLQTMMKDFGGDQLGIRGIISDRNNKFLILVNGRIMNEKTQWGALTERTLSMFGDIHHIDVIRGPGSVLYGPGALAGVINIVTHNGSSFNGMDVQVRQGAVEEFSNIEFRYGHTFKDASSLFVYYGLDNYRGAHVDDAPHIFGHSFTGIDGLDVIAGEPAPHNIPNDNRSYRNRVRHKTHFHYNKENLDLSLRYTRGGTIVAHGHPI